MKTTGSSKTFVMSVKLHGVMCQKTSNLHGDCRKNPNVTSLQLTLSSLFVRSLHLDRVDFLFSYCDIYIYIQTHFYTCRTNAPRHKHCIKFKPHVRLCS